MHIGKETEREHETPLRTLEPIIIEEPEPAITPLEVPEETPEAIPVPNWPMPVKSPQKVGGDYGV